MKILVLNAGSSSVKIAIFDWNTLEEQAGGLVDFTAKEGKVVIAWTVCGEERIRRELEVAGYREAVAESFAMMRRAGLLKDDEPVPAVGHRLIVGGERYRRPVVIDEDVRKEIVRHTNLAPLHIPAGLAAVDAAEDAFPNAVQVGVFDTAFYGDLPPTEYLYPLPYRWYEEWGIRRWGYHGTSHAWALERAANMLGREPSSLRIVSVHLGQGASATAIEHGRAVANTMGYTPLEGLMMGTRCGSVDPGILTHVLLYRGVDPEQLEKVLHRESGLLGVSGVSGDFRAVEQAASEGNARAKLALDMYASRVRSAVGALTVQMGGLDALVFTGRIGENAVDLRAEVCRGLECLGIAVDSDKNVSCRPDADITASVADTGPRVLVVRSRENFVIARAARELAS
ncbi:MAG: acetate/propionate family kinase [Planctomycetota bacterium]|nr:MAG: acetate/propionate family kinase [Planctomycetota bacterium]